MSQSRGTAAETRGERKHTTWAIGSTCNHISQSFHFFASSIYNALETIVKELAFFVQPSKMSSELEALRKQLWAAQQREADAQRREQEADGLHEEERRLREEAQ
jgi:uncharacterized damage-inducible protein DinB